MYHELSLIVLGDIASGCGWLQQPCRADADRCGGGHLWLRLSCSFSLMRSNRRIKADIIGPNAQSGRFPAMSARPAHPTRSIIGIPAHGTRTENNTTTDNATAPCPHGRQGSAISYALGTHSCRRFASSRGGTTKRSIYDRFM